MRRHLTLWTALGAAITVVAVAVLAFGPASGGFPTLSVPPAFAGWSPKPTPPRKTELQTAEVQCGQTSAPTLTDTRGPFTLLLFARTGAPIYICQSISSQVGDRFAGAAPGCTAAETGSTVPCIAGGEASVGTVGPDSIAVAGRIINDPAGAAAYSIVYGQTGSGVTAVSLVLTDGSHVEATVANDYFAAWWPNTEGTQAMVVTSLSGTSTQPLRIHPGPSWLDARGSTGVAQP